MSPITKTEKRPDDMCSCGHPASFHGTNGCAGVVPGKRPPTWCSCRWDGTVDAGHPDTDRCPRPVPTNLPSERPCGNPLPCPVAAHREPLPTIAAMEGLLSDAGFAVAHEGPFPASEATPADPPWMGEAVEAAADIVTDRGPMLLGLSMRHAIYAFLRVARSHGFELREDVPVSASRSAALRAEMLHEAATAVYSACLNAKDQASRVLRETRDNRDAARAALVAAEKAGGKP